MPHKKLHPEKGAVLLVAVLGVGLFALGAALTIATGAFSELAKNRNIVSGDQIFYTGEAGVSEGTYQFLSSSSYVSGVPQLLNNADSGTITVTPLTWPYVRITGRAENATTHRGISRVISLFPEGEVFDYGIYSEGDLDLNSGSITIDGNIFVNGDADFKKNADVTGDVLTAGDVTGNTSNVNGSIATSVQPISAPTLDLTPYRNLAVRDGMLFATSTVAGTYVDGNTFNNAFIVDDDTAEMKLTNSKTVVTGSIVTAGDLTLGGGIFSASSTTATMYAAIVVGGDLTISGGTAINGIAYVKGTTTFTGSGGVIQGSLISLGGVIFKGNASLTFDPDTVASWQNLAGLNKTTTSTPEVLSWDEE